MAHRSLPSAAPSAPSLPFDTFRVIDGLGGSTAINNAAQTVVATPVDAAEVIVSAFRSMAQGVVLLFLDGIRRPMLALSVANAPRNEFEFVFDMLHDLDDPLIRFMILGVLSPEACVEAEPFVFGENRPDTTERLAVEAATVHAWAQFACQLGELGIVLLDVIECSPFSWASVHAPYAYYDDRRDRRLGVRAPTVQSRVQRAKRTSSSASTSGIEKNGE